MATEETPRLDPDVQLARRLNDGALRRQHTRSMPRVKTGIDLERGVLVHPIYDAGYGFVIYVETPIAPVQLAALRQIATEEEDPGGET